MGGCREFAKCNQNPTTFKPGEVEIYKKTTREVTNTVTSEWSIGAELQAKVNVWIIDGSFTAKGDYKKGKTNSQTEKVEVGVTQKEYPPACETLFECYAFYTGTKTLESDIDLRFWFKCKKSDGTVCKAGWFGGTGAAFADGSTLCKAKVKRECDSMHDEKYCNCSAGCVKLHCNCTNKAATAQEIKDAENGCRTQVGLPAVP